MTYDELIKEFAVMTNTGQEEAGQFIDSFFGIMRVEITGKEPLEINGLGSFSPIVIQTKLTKNNKSKKIEILPDRIYPQFVYAQAGEKKPKSSKKKKAKIDIIGKAPKEVRPFLRLIIKFYKKTVIICACITVVFSLGLYASLMYLKNKAPSQKPGNHIEKDLNSDKLSPLYEEDDKRVPLSISMQMEQIEEEQEAFLKKISNIEEYLQEKIAGMIQSQLNTNDKRVQVEMMLYTVKENDTLWGLSEKHLKNPYNWVGLYKANGEGIENSDKIYPGQKIFIPIIKEY